MTCRTFEWKMTNSSQSLAPFCIRNVDVAAIFEKKNKSRRNCDGAAPQPKTATAPRLAADFAAATALLGVVFSQLQSVSVFMTPVFLQ